MQWKMKIGTNFKINTTSIHGKHVSMVNYCKKKQQQYEEQQRQTIGMRGNFSFGFRPISIHDF